MLIVAALLVKKPRIKRILLIILLGIFYIFTNNTVLSVFLDSWEMEGITQVDSVYDVGIVLGGWIAEYDQPTDRVVFKQVPGRFTQAYKLYRQGKIKQILISGGSGHLLYPWKNEAKSIKKYLLRIGVPESDILTETDSRNTYQNAVFTKRLLDNHPEIQSALLITSAIHVKRALKCFEKAGMPVDVYGTDKIVPHNRPYNFENLFIPDVITFYQWHLLIHEWMGYVAYKWKGYI
jgi:uncharacterized SAM-binding protein YcdF (DUF218 family)